MSRRSLAETVVQLLCDCEGVTHVRKEGPIPSRGKRRIKIVKNGEGIVFCVTEPDFPRYNIHVFTTSVEAVVRRMSTFLAKEGVETIFAK